MFEHLDDHDDFRPPASMLATVTREGRRRRRRTRVAQAGTTTVAALAVGVGVAVTTVNRKLDSVERIEVAALDDDPPAAGEPYTILLVGEDGAVGLEDGRRSSRSDSIALVRIFPAEAMFTFLQLPRDLLVGIPGHGQGRINSALPTGGPSLLVRTIEQNLGLEVDRYASIDFEGARAIGDAIGGLRFDFEHPVRDRMTGFGIDEPGCHTLDGAALLALVRSRHLEVQTRPGHWETDRGYDLSRMERQQAVSIAALEAFSRLDARDPAEAARFVDAVVDNIVLDSTFDRSDMLQLFRDIAGSRGSDVGFRYEPTTLDNGAEVLTVTSDRYFDEAVHLFMEGELPADRPPVDPADVFPPPELQPQPQHFSSC